MYVYIYILFHSIFLFVDDVKKQKHNESIKDSNALDRSERLAGSAALADLRKQIPSTTRMKKRFAESPMKASDQCVPLRPE